MKKALLPYWPLLLFLILTHLFYNATWNAGFVTDFSGFLSRVEGRSFKGILDCFGFPALEQVLNLFLFLIYKLFGTSPLPWYIIFTSVHALNAFLAYRLSLRLFEYFKLHSPKIVAISAALFFLLSPYQSEVVVWRVCLNYLMVTFLILSTLIQITKWLENGHLKHLIFAHSLFLIALFTFELALIVPFFGVVLILIFARYGPRRLPLLQLFSRLSLPQFSILGLYFLLNRYLLGIWVGHYGADVHLKFDFNEILGNSLRFFIKLSTFARYYPHTLKEKIFGALGQEEAGQIYLALLILIGLVTYFLVKKSQPKIWLSSFCICMTLIALLPVLNLYFNFLLHIENDRYGYLASVFLFMLLALIFSLFPKIIQIGLITAYLFISGFFLLRTNQYWASSTQVYYGLLDNFQWMDKDHVFLLNLPDNLKGAPMFRDYSKEQSAFKSPLKYLRNQAFEGTIHEVIQYNMTDQVNGVTVQTDSMSLKVEFKQWGNWWWRKGIGAGNTETQWFKFSNKGHHYNLLLKEIPSNAAFLYQDGQEWKEISITKPLEVRE